MTDTDDWLDDGEVTSNTSHGQFVSDTHPGRDGAPTARAESRNPVLSDDDLEELDAERVPADLPPMLGLMRNASADVSTSKLTRQGVAIEVLVCISGRLHDAALLAVGRTHWWGAGPSRFALVSHHEPGIFDVRVPQDSAWRMFHRGDEKAPTFRSGHLVGMRVGARDSAELTYGPYTIYVRCVAAPALLVGRFDLARYKPSPMSFMAVAAAVIINLAVLALPGRRQHFFNVPVAEEEFHEVVVAAAEAPPEMPVPELQPDPPEVALVPQTPAAPTRTQPPLRTKATKVTKDQVEEAASATTIEVAEVRHASTSGFQVSGPTKSIAEPLIERGKAPPLAEGIAVLRDERPGQSRLRLTDKSGADSAFKINPPGRLEIFDVHHVINSHGRDLNRCHDANPEANGRLELTWIVNEDGTVRAIHVLLDELHSPEMYKCVRDAVSRWSFPRPKGGPAAVTFPFRFTNANL